MVSDNPRTRSMLRQADRVANSGKRAAAEQLYRQILDEAPDTAGAWVGLATVIDNPAEQRAAYEKALELEPNNKAALTGRAALLGETPAPEESDQDAPAERETSSQPELSADGYPTAGAEGSAAEPAYSPEIVADPVPGRTAGDEDHDHHHVAVDSAGEVLYCAVHPSRQTHLRCNKCGKPICSSCAQPTPVGYRCRECIREREDIFYTAGAADYIIAAVVAFPLGLIAGYIAGLLSNGFIGFLVIFLGPIIGGFIGRVTHRAVGRRRGRGIPYIVGAAIIVGAILPALGILLALLFGQPTRLLSLLWIGIYIFSATGSAYYQLK